jgi:hypothetical protein
MLPEIEQCRARLRAMDYIRRTPADVEIWRGNDIDARANNRIEGIESDTRSDALFAMLIDEAVPVDLAATVIVRLHLEN